MFVPSICHHFNKIFTNERLCMKLSVPKEILSVFIHSRQIFYLHGHFLRGSVYPVRSLYEFRSYFPCFTNRKIVEIYIQYSRFITTSSIPFQRESGWFLWMCTFYDRINSDIAMINMSKSCLSPLSSSSSFLPYMFLATLITIMWIALLINIQMVFICR